MHEQPCLWRGSVRPGQSDVGRRTSLTFSTSDFPTRRILAIVGDKWTTVVLYCLSIREHRRFNELQKQIPDISKKMLIQTLRNLERDGLLERTVYQQVPPKTEYRLTDSWSQAEGADRLALRVGHEQSRVHRWHHQGPSKDCS